MPHIYQFEKIIKYKRDSTVYTNFIHSKIKRKGKYVSIKILAHIIFITIFLYKIKFRCSEIEFCEVSVLILFV